MRHSVNYIKNNFFQHIESLKFLWSDSISCGSYICLNWGHKSICYIMYKHRNELNYVIPYYVLLELEFEAIRYTVYYKYICMVVNFDAVTLFKVASWLSNRNSRYEVSRKLQFMKQLYFINWCYITMFQSRVIFTIKNLIRLQVKPQPNRLQHQ